MGLDQKTCTTCKALKPLSEFNKCKQAKDGLRHSCRVCTSEYQRRWRSKAGKDEVYDKRRKEKRAAMNAKYGVNVRTLHHMGMTPHVYFALLEAQGGACAICGTGKPGGRGRWHIDHDHSCCPGRNSCGDCIRGLLCSRCNVALGMFRDCMERTEAALDYLQHGHQRIKDILTSARASDPDDFTGAGCF